MFIYVMNAETLKHVIMRDFPQKSSKHRDCFDYKIWHSTGFLLSSLISAHEGHFMSFWPEIGILSTCHAQRKTHFVANGTIISLGINQRVKQFLVPLRKSLFLKF